MSGVSNKPGVGTVIGPLPRASARWLRGLLMSGLAAGVGAGAVIFALDMGLHVLPSMGAGVVCGGAVGLAAGLGLFAAEDSRLARDRATIVRRIRRLGTVEREANFEVLRAIDDSHPYAELCAALQGVMIDAHRDRLEAAMLRRDLEDRVVKTASKQTAHLTRMSLTDELTGLANRRGFDQGLEELVARAQRDRVDLCLLAFDLDHFKQLNDTLGHEKGDVALVAAGEIIRAHVREHDLGARVGGDELFFALIGLSVADAVRVADRIRDLFRVHPAGQGLPCPWPGMSVGIASVHVHGARDAATLRRMADAAMYAAKRAGRGQTSVYGAGSEPDGRQAA